MVNSNLAYQDIEVEIPQIKDEPVKWCTVALSEVLQNGHRLEASVYDAETRQAKITIQNSKYGSSQLTKKGWLIKEAYHAPRFKRNYVNKRAKNAVGFLGSSDILDVHAKPQKYILSSLAQKLDLFVEPQMVLLSCSGTIGNISFVNKNLSPFAISQHVIKLSCYKYSGYIYTCLKHPLISSQVKSLIYGSVIQEIEPEHLDKVVIPNAPQLIMEKIHNLIIESYKLRDESNALIDNATQLLINELHLPDISEFEVNDYKKNAPVETFSVKLSDLNGRADASYHLPIVDAIVNHLRKYAEEVTTVGDERISSDIILPGRFKRVYVDKEYGVRFLGGKELNQLDPSTEKYLSKKAHANQLKDSLGIKPNSLLTPARGSLGEVVFPPKHFKGWAISDNLMQILSFDSICGYLYIFLNTKYGKTLIKRFTYGGVVDAIEPEHIKQVAIPLLKNKSTQKKINDLALEANQKRYESYKLEQQALKTMDNEVIFAK